MKAKKILLISCFIIIFLSLNTISATTSNDEITNSIDDSQTADDILTDSNTLKQENNIVYVNGNSEKDDEDGSIQSPYKTINDENLQKIAPKSTLYVSNGTYELNSMNITKDISIVGESREQVIFNLNGNKCVFTIENNVNVNFFNFTLKNFDSDTDSAITNKGNLLIENVNIINNTGTFKTSKRGNIFNEGTLEVRNSTFENNTASFAAAIFNTKNALIINSDFNTNHIYNVGGAIYSIRGNLTVYDSRFYKNAAVSGAAIYNAAGYSYVNNTKFIENDAEHFFGGGIYSTGVTIVNNSLFDSNHANMDGGAITNTNNFTIINCSFIENFANDNGGAIENVPWSATENGNLTIFNSSFIGNSAGNLGGVIINYHKDELSGEWATVTVRNCLFNENTATTGGVIYNELYMDFENNVFLDNEADENNIIYSEESSIKSLDNNWWGNNNPSEDEIGVMPDKWIILNFTNTTAFVTNFKTNLQVSLNTNNYGETINSPIPERIATFSAERTVLPENNLKITGTLNYTIKSLGDDITVCVDNQDLTLHPAEKMDVIVTYDLIEDTVYGDNVTITGKFMDANTKAISNSNVNVYINGKQYKARTDKTGTYTLTAPATKIGTNTVVVGYGGSACYNSFEDSTTFNAGKQDVIVTYETISSVAYGDNVTVTGKFTDKNGKAISNSNVDVYINGKQYKARTDKTGTYILKAPATRIGTNTVVVGYGGSACYNSFEDSTTFNAGKQSVIVTCEKISDVSYGDNVTITGKFTDKNGKAISNSNVNVYINGKQYKARTDKTGTYKLVTPATKIGNNTVVVGYGGNDYYTSYETTTTFKVKRN